MLFAPILAVAVILIARLIWREYHIYKKGPQ